MSYGIQFDSEIIDNDLNTYATYGIYRVYFSAPSFISNHSITIPGLVFNNNYEYLLGHNCSLDMSISRYVTINTNILNLKILNNGNVPTGTNGFLDIVVLAKSKYCFNNYYDFGIQVFDSNSNILFNSGLKYAVPLELYYCPTTGSDVDSSGYVVSQSLFGRVFIFTTIIISSSLYVYFSESSSIWAVSSSNRYDDCVVLFLNYY
jgi:hypothetical protein